LQVQAEKRQIERLTPTEFELLLTWLVPQAGFHELQLIDAMQVAFGSYERAVDAY
jgi:hypothetical protein